MKLTEAEIMDFLRKVDSREITLKSVGGWGYSGVASFIASNGWSVKVFNDCDEWDYIEEIVTPDGKTHEFSDAWPEGGRPVMGELLSYEPPDDEIWIGAPLEEGTVRRWQLGS